MPAYETKANLLDEEHAISSWLSRHPKLTYAKTPKFYPFDFYTMKDGVAQSFVEVKVRRADVSKYGSLIVSLQKLAAIGQYTDLTGIPSIILLHDENGLHSWRLTPGYLSVQRAGRTDRGDPNDMEPCVHIPFKAFHFIRPLEFLGA